MRSTVDQGWAADAAAQLRPPAHWTFGPAHVDDALVSPDELPIAETEDECEPVAATADEWPLPDDGIAVELPLAS